MEPLSPRPSGASPLEAGAPPASTTPIPDAPIPATETPAALLEVEGLRVSFPPRGRDGHRVEVVRDLSFRVGRGEIVGLVGESGSGKSLTALSLLRLVPPPGRLDSGRLCIDGEDIATFRGSALRRLRGGRIGMIFQEPSTALNPVLTIGYQVVEAIRAHRPLSRREAKQEAARLLELVAVSDPQQRLAAYPHQLSGGQRQRVMIAIALAGEPDLLVADEPTTALDVTIQAQILDLLQRLRDELRLAVLLITHDLAVVAETCDRVLVMYAGELVERAPVEALFAAPAHPYTEALLGALPRLGAPSVDGRLATVEGRVPEPGHLPPGCAFHPRCPRVFERCRSQSPGFYPALPTTVPPAPGDDRGARCFLHDVPPRETPSVAEADAATERTP